MRRLETNYYVNVNVLKCAKKNSDKFRVHLRRWTTKVTCLREPGVDAE